MFDGSRAVGKTARLYHFWTLTTSILNLLVSYIFLLIVKLLEIVTEWSLMTRMSSPVF